MAHFRFAVSGQYLDLLNPTRGISDGLYVNSFEFMFRSPEWANCQEKWVHFYNPDYNNGVPYDYNLIDDAIRPERGVNLPAGVWDIYLHGVVIVNGEIIKRYVTTTQSIEIVQSGIFNAEPISSLEPTVAEQVSALAHDAYNSRITTASGTVDSGYGTPEVDVSITGDNAYKNINFDFHNLKGNGIASVVFTEEGINKGLLTVTLDNGQEIVYPGIRDALNAISTDNILQRLEALESAISEG